MPDHDYTETGIGINILSAKELINSPVPEIRYRILGLLRARGGRMSITGQYKMKKSFLALNLSLRVAAGDEWLSYKTTKGKVLYVNLEISQEKLQERTQDLQQKLNYPQEILENLLEASILDRNLSLDESVLEIQGILDHCKANGVKINMLVLDPRARLISGSENEEVVIKKFCDNIDYLLTENSGLSVIIVTHMGKDPSKGAIGHSRFSGWLDTEITISGITQKKEFYTLTIKGRDTESSIIQTQFKYPLHEVVPEQQAIRKNKVQEAIKFITAHLTKGNQTEQKLRQKARAEDITDYAFHSAIRELKDSHNIEVLKASGQGNRKLLQLAAKKGDT